MRLLQSQICRDAGLFLYGRLLQRKLSTGLESRPGRPGPMSNTGVPKRGKPTGCSRSADLSLAAPGRVSRLPKSAGSDKGLKKYRKPSFARYLVPRQTGLRRELNRYLRYYNRDRAHTGRWNRGRTPGEVIGKGRIYS